MHLEKKHIPSVPKTDDAVGVPRQKWFIAIVNNKSEKANAERLVHMGYECYVPTQTETSVWSDGKKHTRERIVLPAKIFIHSTEAERREIVRLSFISRFMTNPAGGKNQFNRNPIATVPDKEIATLRFMLDNAESSVEISPMTLVKGDRVRILRGSLQGLEGIVTQESGRSRFYVALDILGCAHIDIDGGNLEIIQP